MYIMYASGMKGVDKNFDMSSVWVGALFVNLRFVTLDFLYFVEK